MEFVQVLTDELALKHNRTVAPSKTAAFATAKFVCPEAQSHKSYHRNMPKPNPLSALLQLIFAQQTTICPQSNVGNGKSSNHYFFGSSVTKGGRNSEVGIHEQTDLVEL